MNRSRLVLMNFVVVMLTTVVNILFGMAEVSLLISIYGSTINGLKQTGGQLLSYLSLIEAGIGASYLYNMYRPIAEGNYDKLSSLYSGFNNSIRKVVIKMLSIAIFVSFAYPFFLRGNGLSYFTMVSVFVLLSAKAIVPYLFTYVPKYMIIAKEQRYKVELINCLSNATTYIIEIILLLTTNIPLQVLLLISVFIAVASGLVYKFVMNKIYGNIISYDAIPDFTPKKMSKDVMIHNISGLVFNSTDNVIISIFSSLSSVTIYSSYNLIVYQVSSIFQSIFDGITASLGIKIANKDKNSYSVYRELFSGTLFVGAIISTVFIVMINEFVGIWIGDDYRISLINCYLFGFILYSGLLLPCIYSTRNACGLYKESKVFTILQAVVNLGFTLILTPFIGLMGALIGTLVARLAITVPCNYILVEKKVFSKHKLRWHELLIGVGLVFVLTTFEIIIYPTINSINSIENTYVSFVFNAIIITSITCLVIFAFYFSTDSGFRSLIKKRLHKF